MSNSLTVTEKNHWKDRIAKRIDRQIDALFAEERGFKEQINQAARNRALESLGIRKLQEQADRLEKQESVLESRKRKTRREMLARVRGVPARHVSEAGYYSIEAEVSEAIEKRQSLHEEELLGETARGREILNLRLEKENLLDTVWLATSPKQVKELWRKVDEMLGGQQTALQRDALAIEPVDDE